MPLAEGGQGGQDPTGPSSDGWPLKSHCSWAVGLYTAWGSRYIYDTPALVVFVNNYGRLPENNYSKYNHSYYSWLQVIISGGGCPPRVVSGSGCSCKAAGDLTVYRRGEYIYMQDLGDLDARRPLKDPTIPAGVGVVNSTLVASEWEAVLASHPDREFAAFVVRGIQEGFRIGFDYRRQSGQKASRNMRSAGENPEPIDRYVQAELQAGRLIRLSGNFPVRTSRLGVIPKPHQPGKWRLITDLSSRKGESINDGIDTGPALWRTPPLTTRPDASELLVVGRYWLHLTLLMPTGRSRCIQQIDFFSGCHCGVIRWWTGPSPSVSGRRLNSSRLWPMLCCGG